MNKYRRCNRFKPRGQNFSKHSNWFVTEQNLTSAIILRKKISPGNTYLFHFLILPTCRRRMITVDDALGSRVQMLSVPVRLTLGQTIYWVTQSDWGSLPRRIGYTNQRALAVSIYKLSGKTKESVTQMSRLGTEYCLNLSNFGMEYTVHTHTHTHTNRFCLVDTEYRFKKI